MSFNVRTSAMDDKDGDNRWDNRKATVAGIVANHRPAVCGMQVRAAAAAPGVCGFLSQQQALQLQ
jgi:hypothetical protein